MRRAQTGNAATRVGEGRTGAGVSRSITRGAIGAVGRKGTRWGPRTVLQRSTPCPLPRRSAIGRRRDLLDELLKKIVGGLAKDCVGRDHEGHAAKAVGTHA